MRIGLPKEIKNHEYRVGLTDALYQSAGATLAADAAEVFAWAEMIVKVKEPQPQECAMLRSGQILYTYLHLAPDPEQTQALIKSGAVCIAYETITGPGGGLPLLAPMSEVAGRMAVQAGAAHLEKSKGGMGVLLGGVPGVPAGPGVWQPHQHGILQRAKRGRRGAGRRAGDRRCADPRCSRAQTGHAPDDCPHESRRSGGGRGD